MLATVAVLIIVIGLVLNLARYVREASSEKLTRRLLANLDTALARYVDNQGMPPAVPAIAADPTPLPEPAELADRAAANNAALIRQLKNDGDLTDAVFGDLPVSIYDEASLRDAWGNPIVFMPGAHAAVGMAPQNRPFFFSGGPDRLYGTRDDNVYSYEAR